MRVALDGKKALVTGGTRGIGRAVALGIATAGADVIACYRNEGEAVDSLAVQLKEIPGDHHLVRADVSQPDDVDRLVKTCEDTYGGLDVVVNNAGAISHIPFEELELDEWRRVVDANLTSAFMVTKRTLPILSGGASIVLIGSKVAAVGVPMRSHYTAAKAGLVGLARSLCKELGPKGIRINVVAPGIIDTNPLPPEVLKRYQTIIALGRLGHAEEIANLVTFLASDLASYITGETINADGGT
ncbi:MAG TPA: SDR family NAD(P)-dependent oxidoreductase [Pseudonocardiaceae bacterium]|nr:SDR family NAD(P)-dependent oxidoreductase [Pseudonocardiaceae bacterium]